MLALNKVSEGPSLRREPIQDQLTGEAVSQLTLPLCGDSRRAATLANLHSRAAGRWPFTCFRSKHKRCSCCSLFGCKKSLEGAGKSLGNMSVQG